MSAEQPQWRPVGGGRRRYQKWEAEGEVVQGIYRGTEPGKFGQNALLEDEDGTTVVLTVSAGLKDLTKVEPGTLVKVTFQKWAVAKSGMRFRQFRVEQAAGGSRS